METTQDSLLEMEIRVSRIEENKSLLRYRTEEESENVWT